MGRWNGYYRDRQMILSLETLEQCQDARAILVEKHQHAQTEVGKYLTNQNLARKGLSQFRYDLELKAAQENLAGIVDALTFVKKRVHDIKFGGMNESAFIMRAIRQVYGNEGALAVIAEMSRIREEVQRNAVARPGLALEPVGVSGNMKVRYL